MPSARRSSRYSATIFGVTAARLYFFSFSTFLARQGLYLEDLYVLPEERSAGAGRAATSRGRYPGRQADGLRLRARRA